MLQATGDVGKPVGRHGIRLSRALAPWREAGASGTRFTEEV
ncbi:MAG: hypothetical protein M5R38_15635 [Candidatus Methylomirabilis sp.]|nr:hypothetical protein [Candidatus Methylomirabilis sp.]